MKPIEKTIFGALAILVITFVVYIPSIKGGFIWDDGIFLVKQPLTHDPGGIWKYFKIFGKREPVTDYWPVTSASLWLEWRLWHTDDALRANLAAGKEVMPETEGFHVVNILLHAFSAILIWQILARLKIPGAWFAALLFALHPVNVMSVSWITERKNTLSLFIAAISMLLFLKYDEVRESETKSPWGYYCWSLGVFLVALLAKISVAPMVAVLVMIAYWKRGRIRWRDLWAAAPYFVMGVILALINVRFQMQFAIGQTNPRDGDVPNRIVTALWNIWFYLGKTFWPFGVNPTYDRWKSSSSLLLQYGPLIPIVAILALAIIYRRTWGKAVLFAGGFFLAMLAPVLGFIDMSFMHISFVSDHMQYLAIIGTIAFFAAVVYKFAPRKMAVAILAVIAVSYAGMSMLQERSWKNLHVFWLDAGSRNPDAPVPYYSLGHNEHQAGEEPDKDTQHYLGHFHYALSMYQLAVEKNPAYGDAWNNMGVVYDKLGDMKHAMDAFTKGVEVGSIPNKPSILASRAKVWHTLGQRQQAQGQYQEALEYFKKAIQDCDDAIADAEQLGPDSPAAAGSYYNRAASLNALAEIAGEKINGPHRTEALYCYKRAIELYPTFMQARRERAGMLMNLAGFKAANGDSNGAVGDFKAAAVDWNVYLQASPQDLPALGSLTICYYRTGDTAKALKEYAAYRKAGGTLEAMQQIDPQVAQAIEATPPEPQRPGKL